MHTMHVVWPPMVDSGTSSCTRPVMLPTSASVRCLSAGIEPGAGAGAVGGAGAGGGGCTVVGPRPPRPASAAAVASTSSFSITSSATTSASVGSNCEADKLVAASPAAVVAGLPFFAFFLPFLDAFTASASALASSSARRRAIIASARACSSSRERPPRAPPATTDAPTALDAAAAHDEVLCRVAAMFPSWHCAKAWPWSAASLSNTEARFSSRATPCPPRCMPPR